MRGRGCHGGRWQSFSPSRREKSVISIELENVGENGPFRETVSENVEE